MRYLATALLVAIAGPLAAQQGGQPQDPVQGFMMRFDTNKDGTVSIEEFRTPHMQMIDQQFSYMDKNGDGSIDEEELQVFSQEMQQRMQQMHQQQSPQSGYQR